MSGMMANRDAHHHATLNAFRSRLSAACGRRRDALFELCEMLLTTGPVASLPHVSLQPHHARGWGSLDDARAVGERSAAAGEPLLAAHPLADAEPIDAGDASVWMRGDAETSPGRAIS
jgi:hypothetical protein